MKDEYRFSLLSQLIMNRMHTYAYSYVLLRRLQETTTYIFQKKKNKRMRIGNIITVCGAKITLSYKHTNHVELSKATLTGRISSFCFLLSSRLLATLL